MKNTCIFCLFIFLSIELYGQNQQKDVTAASKPYRAVEGLVRDSSGKNIDNVNVLLTSELDSLSTNSHEGKFIFPKVRMPVFTLIFTKVGYRNLVKRCFYNGTIKKIALEPSFMKARVIMLNEVVIDGTPMIVYKTDTVEYRARDYKVREYANVEEILKKMPGMEVASNGTVLFHGQSIVKARLNGKDFAGGDVAQAIKSLPADIVDKIQVVDYYDDQADKTGIKDGDPKKIINITTKSDRSIGSIARLIAGGGNDSRYNADLNLQHINANQELGLIGNVSNTLNGVASNSIPGNDNNTAASKASSSGGNTVSQSLAVYYRDQLGKKIQINSSYSIKAINASSINISNGQLFSSVGSYQFSNLANGLNGSKRHSVDFEMEYAIDNDNFLRVIPDFSYNSSGNSSSYDQSLTGLSHWGQAVNNLTSNSSPNLAGLVFYQHKFKNPLRNFTVQVNASKSHNDFSNQNSKELTFYKDFGPTILKDSLTNYRSTRNSSLSYYKTALTYVEPVGYLSQLQFVVKNEVKNYGNSAFVDSIDINKLPFRLSALTNDFRYSFTQSRIDLGYWKDRIKYNFSIGLTLLEYELSAESMRNYSPSNKSYFNIIPIMKFQYVWSNTQRLSINYSGQPLEPSSNQIQPFTDKSDPQNVTVGNPFLKPSFYNSLTLQYNNYLSASQFNITGGIYSSFFTDQVISNTIQIYNAALNSFSNEIHYTNAGTRSSVIGALSLSKQLDDRKFLLSIISRAGYSTYTTMSNSHLSFNRAMRYNEKLTARMNPQDWLEINPAISSDINQTYFGVNGSQTKIRTTVFSLDGRFFFAKTWLIGYVLNKNYVTGISSDITKNPFIVDTYFEKQFLKRRNLILNVGLFDALHQNNYINRVVTDNSVVDTRTNSLSRYLMISLRLNLQKWGGAPMKNGIKMQRRGDGSFIY